MKLVVAQPAHYTAVAALLEGTDLTTGDLDSSLTGFVVLLDGERVVAAGGLEMLGANPSAGGLIRSVVVDPAFQRQGLGKRIYQRLEQDARDRGLDDLYLLTESAESYFEPRADSTVHFKLSEGMKTKILKSEGNWLKIRRMDGKTGWVDMQVLERI